MILYRTRIGEKFILNGEEIVEEILEEGSYALNLILGRHWMSIHDLIETGFFTTEAPKQDAPAKPEPPAKSDSPVSDSPKGKTKE